jgi:hypothetical protein
MERVAVGDHGSIAVRSQRADEREILDHECGDRGERGEIQQTDDEILPDFTSLIIPPLPRYVSGTNHWEDSDNPNSATVSNAMMSALRSRPLATMSATPPVPSPSWPFQSANTVSRSVVVLAQAWWSIQRLLRCQVS